MSLIGIALLAIILAIAGAFFLTLEIYVGVIGHFKGAPFVRSRKDRIATMIELARIGPGMRVVDLGSGDGSILIAAAKQGAIAAGVEFNPFLVAYSRFRARRAGVGNKVHIIKGDLFNYPLAQTDIVFLYLLPKTLRTLESKLRKELKPSARIISNAFLLADRTPIEEKNDVRVYRI